MNVSFLLLALLSVMCHIPVTYLFLILLVIQFGCRIVSVIKLNLSHVSAVCWLYTREDAFLDFLLVYVSIHMVIVSSPLLDLRSFVNFASYTYSQFLLFLPNQTTWTVSFLHISSSRGSSSSAVVIVNSIYINMYVQESLCNMNWVFHFLQASYVLLHSYFLRM